MIHARVSKNPADNSIAELHLSIKADALPGLITILNRALNCWPEAPAEWKQLADMLVHGKVLQNYSDELEKSRPKVSSDYRSLDELERVRKLIALYGIDEWLAYLANAHEISLSAWEEQMRNKHNKALG